MSLPALPLLLFPPVIRFYPAKPPFFFHFHLHLLFLTSSSSVASCRLLITFPLTSFFTIFCNILLEPLSGSAKTDLWLLECLADVVRRRFLREASDTGKVHAKVVNDFTDDLIRLGRSAIANAEKGLTRPVGSEGGDFIKHVPQVVVPADLVDSTNWMLDLT